MPLSAARAAIHPDDTIVALSSARGPGARAIVRVSGPGTLAAIEAVFTALNDQAVAHHRFLPGTLRLSGVHSPVPARLYFFRGPKTYTGQDLAELHLVGSMPLVERLVADLLQVGARPALPGEFTMRAFLAGKKDLTQAEAVNAAIEARTDNDLQLALTQLAGGVARPLHALREDLLNLLADVEAALDFSDENIEFVSKKDTLDRIDSALNQLAALLQKIDRRTVSGRPVRIALVGLPNAGKSSLFNALGGDAIVGPVPGTTRDYLTREIDLGGARAELIDTAGWQGDEDTIVIQAQRLGREQAGQADVILWCAESGTEFRTADAERLQATGGKIICVRTKSDLFLHSQSDGAVPVSVMTSSGLDSLLATLAETVGSLIQSPLAPSQSRCRHHVAAAIQELERSRESVSANQPPELTAASLRSAIDQLGEMTGAVYTNDLLDRIFSRFCIGK